MGDLILTGTPDGVGVLEDGDHLTGEMSFGGKKLANLDFKVELI